MDHLPPPWTAPVPGCDVHFQTFPRQRLHLLQLRGHVCTCQHCLLCLLVAHARWNANGLRHRRATSGTALPAVSVHILRSQGGVRHGHVFLLLLPHTIHAAGDEPVSSDDGGGPGLVGASGGRQQPACPDAVVDVAVCGGVGRLAELVGCPCLRHPLFVPHHHLRQNSPAATEFPSISSHLVSLSCLDDCRQVSSRRVQGVPSGLQPRFLSLCRRGVCWDHGVSLPPRTPGTSPHHLATLAARLTGFHCLRYRPPRRRRVRRGGDPRGGYAATWWGNLRRRHHLLQRNGAQGSLRRRRGLLEPTWSAYSATRARSGPATHRTTSRLFLVHRQRGYRRSRPHSAAERGCSGVLCGVAHTASLALNTQHTQAGPSSVGCASLWGSSNTDCGCLPRHCVCSQRQGGPAQCSHDSPARPHHLQRFGQAWSYPPPHVLWWR
mmetsp:Transcript_16923/g.40254  ORF Transcript_16923/g.40254 Transcript_16923/m.40254 type:complete len:436 (-) Transcript_16923:388-1695(-)